MSSGETPVRMTASLERKIAAIVIELDTVQTRGTGPRTHQNFRQAMDDPEVAHWISECKRAGFGHANLFSTPHR